MIRLLCALLLLLMNPATSFAQSEDDLKILDYPELQVTPSASQRLERMAKSERSDRLSNHSSMLVSSVATLVAAFQATDSPQIADDPDNVDQNDYSVQAGLAVGGGWLVANLLLMMSYKPYETGYKEIRKMPAKDKRQKLAKERFAEEALYEPAKLGSGLLWFSVITNLAASAYIMGYGDDDAKLAGGVAALASFAPVFFPYDWISTANQHRSYKKKIYGPVAGVTIMSPVAGRKANLGFGLTYSF